jgi:hypothetical protein
MRKIAVSAALALTFVPTAFAGPAATAADRARAVNDCQILRPAMNSTLGAGTFRRAFGTAQRARLDAFRNCVARFTVAEHQNRHQAVVQCDESTAASTDADAFGRCVAATMRAKSRADRRATMNAARTCKTQQADAAFASTHDGKTFGEFYGTGENDRNAYGKCVAAVARAQNSG